MVSTAARVGSINVLLSVNSAQGVSGLNAFAGAIDRTGAGVSRSVAGIDRSIGGLNRSLGNINTRGMTSLTLGALRAGTALDQLRGFALAAGVAVGGLMPAAIAAGMIRTVDGAHRLSNQLRTVTADAADLKNTQQELFDVAQRSRSSFEATTTIYARTARAVEHLNMKQKDLLRMTETVQKAFAVGGATTAEAWGGAVQLSQGIASNRFSGDEFRSVAENAPVLLQGMARHLGVTIGKLREMAHAGQLTADVVTRAIIGASQEIDEAFAKTTSTIEQAWTRVGNAVTKYAMDSKQADAASLIIVGTLNMLAENVGTVADAFGLLGVAMVSAFTGRGLSAVGSWASNLKKARLESLKAAQDESKAAAQALSLAKQQAEQAKIQEIVARRRGVNELRNMRAGMSAANVKKMAAAEMELAAAATRAGDARATADLKAAAAKTEASQKWSHFMAVARREKKEAIDSARATLVAAEAQKAANATRLTGARAYYEMSKAAGVSQKTQIAAGKGLQTAMQADLRATSAVAAAQTRLDAALAGTADKSKAYLSAQRAMETAKAKATASATAAATAEAKYTQAVAAHAAAQKATQAAIASGNLTKEQQAALLARGEALERRVIAAKAGHAAATAAATAAEASHAAALKAVDAAQQSVTRGAIAMGAARRAGGFLLGLVGGAPGAAILGILGTLTLVGSAMSNADAATEDWKKSLRDAGLLAEDAADKAAAIDEAIKTGNTTRLREELAKVNVELDRIQHGNIWDRLLGRINNFDAVIKEVNGDILRLSDSIASMERAGLNVPEAMTAQLADFERFLEIIEAVREAGGFTQEFREELQQIANRNKDLDPLLSTLDEIAPLLDAGSEAARRLENNLARLDGTEVNIRINYSDARAAEDASMKALGDMQTRGEAYERQAKRLASMTKAEKEFADEVGRVRKELERREAYLPDSAIKDIARANIAQQESFKTAKAPRKTADDRFDNMLQALTDRTEALRQERESLNLNYAEQLRREESLKLEQEALKQVREEARRKGETDWQNAQLTPEQVALIRERVNAHVEEAMALKYAKESQDAWKDAAASAGDMMRGLIDGTMDWKTALLQLIPVVLKLMNSLNIAGGGAGIFGGGVFQSFMGSLLGVSFHGGGTVGKTANVVPFPTDAPFAGVFHGGGNFGGRRAKHDEVMALVQEHENIFTSGQTDKIIGALSASVSRMKEGTRGRMAVEVYVNDDGTLGAIVRQASGEAAVASVREYDKGRKARLAADLPDLRRRGAA